MSEITFKVAPKGEGKTKWLLEIAKKYTVEGRKVYLFAADEQEYMKFCEKYFNTYMEICPVVSLTAFQPTNTAVVLVDNLFKHSNHIGDFTFIQRNCYKMCVTLEGTTNFEANKETFNDFYQQLTIDDLEEFNA